MSRPAGDEHCPWLAAALQGRWDEEHGCLIGVQFRLSVKAEGPNYLVSLWGGDQHDRWFWTCHSLDCLIERVEEALKAGKGDWRPPKPYKRG